MRNILIGFGLCLLLLYSTSARVEEEPVVWPHTDSEVVYYTKQQLDEFHVWYMAMGPDVPCESMAGESIMTLERIRNQLMNGVHFYTEGYETYYTLGNNCTECPCDSVKQ